MLIRPIRLEEKELYDSVAKHPVQSWQWGVFQQQQGKKVERVGFFENGKIQEVLQVFFKPIPKFPQYTIGYCPRAFTPDKDQLSALTELGKQHNSVFIRLEPDVSVPITNRAKLKPIIELLLENNCQLGKPFFYQHTYVVDLSQTEEQLFSNLKSKTRYNIRLAIKKGVKIVEDSSKSGLKTYLEILGKTLQRKGFYLHSPEYFKQMWELLANSDMYHIFHAVYDNTPLVSWIMFKWKDKIYYPYGASLDLHKETMASNLMMWEMITWAKSEGAKEFDMWGSLGSKPDQKSPWYGFHKFKEGYGAELMKFAGTFDLVLKQPHYKIFRTADDFRWKMLRIKTKLGLIK